MIPQRNLSLLSNRLARAGGRRIPEAVLERDYCLAWFLVGLSGSALWERLVFKGGTALRRCYFPDYRFSEDLDFSLAEESPLDPVLAGLDAVFEEVRRAPACCSDTPAPIACGTATATRSSWPTRVPCRPGHPKRSSR